MVAHKRIHVRQASTFSSVAGLTGEATLGASTATTTGALVFDTSVTNADASGTAPALAASHTPVVTISASSSAPANSASSSSTSATGSSSQISMSTVIGACIGAFVGALILILLGICFYRRSTQALKARARAPLPPMVAGRNAKAETDRSRSRLENWNKLDEVEDKWEGMHQMEEVDTVGPMEKLTMFKKSPSLRTAITTNTSTEDHSAAFTLQHPHPYTAGRELLGRVDAGPPISWDGETVREDSFLSLRSAHLSNGAMSPTLNMAIPTPPPTSSNTHYWESAEVIHYEEGQTADIVDEAANPFSDEVERRKSMNNPFFNAQPVYKTRNSKGRQLTANPSNPFGDEYVVPDLPTHNFSDSMGSVTSNDRAIQSLIAALDVSPEDVQERLRVASMQPSFISTTSEYTEDVTSAFPLPPQKP